MSSIHDNSHNYCCDSALAEKRSLYVTEFKFTDRLFEVTCANCRLRGLLRNTDAPNGILNLSRYDRKRLFEYYTNYVLKLIKLSIPALEAEIEESAKEDRMGEPLKEFFLDSASLILKQRSGRFGYDNGRGD